MRFAPWAHSSALFDKGALPARDVPTRQRGIIVIPGSSNAAHIAEDLDIRGFSLSKEEMARIAALDRAEKHDWY